MKREKSPAEALYDRVLKLGMEIGDIERSGSVIAYAERWTEKDKLRFAGQLDHTAARLTAVSHDLRADCEEAEIAREWVS